MLQDKCTLEGVSEGDLPPGVRPAGFRPLGTCFNSSDCNAGYDCKMTDEKTICSCDPTTGTDACRPLGSCVMQPCKACEVCVQAMQLFPDIVKDVTKPDAVVDRFRTFCSGTGRDPLTCEAAAAVIAASVGGNLGRRVGAICQALAECSTPPPLCSVATAPGKSASALDLCTSEGVMSGKVPAEVAGQAPAGSCKVNADCGNSEMFCSTAQTQRVCSCAPSTGAVTCELLGACQPTPCRVCSDCIADLQPHVTSMVQLPAGEDNNAAVAAAFQSVCSSRGNPGLMCAASAAFIAGSNKGNLGRRAGALCSMLGECFLLGARSESVPGCMHVHCT